MIYLYINLYIEFFFQNNTNQLIKTNIQNNKFIHYYYNKKYKRRKKYFIISIDIIIKCKYNIVLLEIYI